jgi:Putative outer membrane beta-barrel porin, MtrB/PioB
MTLRIAKSIAIAALLPAALGAADSPPETSVAIDLVAMGRAVSVSVGVPIEFQRYRDVPQGFVMPSLRIDASRGLQFFRFDASDAGEKDRSIDLEIGSRGRWRFAADFDQWPYLHTTHAASPHNYYGRGRLQVHDGVQKEFEAASEGDIPRLGAQLASEAGRRRMAVQRDRVRARFDLQLTRNWSVHAGAREEARNGQRPVSIGAFETLARPGPAFALIGFEVPAAIEIRTSDLTFGTSFRRPRYGVDFDVVYSRFRNSIIDILYDNPFRFTDNADHPLRSSRVISADWPSSTSNAAILSGYFSVTDHIRLATTLGWTRVVQSEKFVSYTVNHAIPTPAGFPPGLGPVNKETLPRPALEGRLTSVSVDHALAWEVTPRATLRVDYRDLDTTDETPELSFPGYVGSGDAAWHTDFDGEPIARPPLSLRNREAVVDLDWRPAKPVSLRAEYRHADRERGGRRGGATEQQSLAGRATARFGNGSFASISVEYSEREPGSSAALTPFDLAGRKRATIRAQGDWSPADSFGIGASVSEQRNDFDDSSVLRNFDVSEAAIALRWFIGETATVTGDLTRSNIRHSQEWAAVPDGVPWRRSTRDDVTDVGLSLEEIFRDGRLSVAFRVTGSFADQRVATSSDAGLNRDWPAVRNGLKDLAAGVEYAFSDRMRVGLQHTYEMFTIEDFAWSTLSPYPLETLDDDTDARRVLFLDTHGEGYHAHQIGLYVRTKFR